MNPKTVHWETARPCCFFPNVFPPIERSSNTSCSLYLVLGSDTLPALSCRFSSRGWISCDAKRSIGFFWVCFATGLHTADRCHRRTSFQSFSRNCPFYRQQRALHQANISTEIQLQYSNTILLVVVRTNNIITIEPTLVFY